MIWLASFPRSGNTFFRIILHEFYGIETTEFHAETGRPVDPGYAGYPVVKTHLLPYQLIPRDPDIKAVYIVRDGRDALVSMAHHRSDIVAPGSDYRENLRAAIIAKERTFFGGWSENVRHWQRRASIILRFEELINDPIGCIESMRGIMDLPPPRPDRMIPTIEQLRHEKLPFNMPYARERSENQRLEWQHKFFRRGKIGSWKDEMPADLHKLFWQLHGPVMDTFGYHEGSPRLGHKRHGETSGFSSDSALSKKQPKHVLIEATAIMMGANDGCQRYVVELLRALVPIARSKREEWQIDIHIGMGKVYDLRAIAGHIFPMDYTATGTPETHDLEREFKSIATRLRIDSCVYNWMRTNLPAALFDRLMIYKRILHVLWHFFGGGAQRGRPLVYHQYDVVHLTIPQFYEAIPNCHTRIVTTIHDLSHRNYPDFHTQNNVLAAENAMHFAISHDSAYITVSDATRHDLFTLYPAIDLDRVITVYEACNPRIFYPVTDIAKLSLVRQKYHLPEATPYILSLSTLEPRKNLVNLIKAFLDLCQKSPELDVILVIAGQKGWKFTEILESRKMAPDRIRFTGFIAEADLAAIFSGAMALAYVSYCEGFGLPPLEAMACGIPVIYGNTSSMPEIIGECGMAADAANISDISAQLHRLITDKELASKLSRLALARARQFSWEKTALETLAVYDAVIAKQNLGTPGIEV